jgi:hypothetical protein
MVIPQECLSLNCAILVIESAIRHFRLEFTEQNIRFDVACIAITSGTFGDDGKVTARRMWAIEPLNPFMLNVRLRI